MRRCGVLVKTTTLVVAGLNADPCAAVWGRPTGKIAQSRTVSTESHPVTTGRYSRENDRLAPERMVVKERAMPRQLYHIEAQR